MRISDWSSDVCSSDLPRRRGEFETDTPALIALLGRAPGINQHKPREAIRMLECIAERYRPAHRIACKHKPLDPEVIGTLIDTLAKRCKAVIPAARRAGQTVTALIERDQPAIPLQPVNPASPVLQVRVR